MFRDCVKEFVGADVQSVNLTRRQINDVFYSGLVEGAKHCGQARDDAELDEMVSDLFDEAEAYVYELTRGQAAGMIANFGLPNARTRLRAIALEKNWGVSEASQYFGVDLTQFSSLEELANLTRVLQNSGISFGVEVHNAGKSPEGPNRVKADLVSTEPVDIKALSRLFGGATVQDFRTTGPTGASEDGAQPYLRPCGDEAFAPGFNDLSEQTSPPDPRESALTDELPKETRISMPNGQSYTRSELQAIRARLTQTLGDLAFLE